MRCVWSIVAVGILGLLQAGCEYLAPFVLRDQSNAPWHHSGVPQATSDQDRLAHCLPAGVTMDTVIGNRGDGAAITVESRLLEIRAQPGQDGKLYDANGREIHFYQRPASRANAPAEAAALAEKQNAELERLKGQYTVIELSIQPKLP
jgi:hypothetical protein